MTVFMVPLSQGLHAIIDAEDAELVLPYRWTAQKSCQTHYAYRWAFGPERKKVYLHRLLMGFPDGSVDHIDGDGLNCRRENMREANHSLQAHNCRRPHTSIYRGVSRDSDGRSWRAQITVEGKKVFLGRFAREEDAADAYNVAAAVEYGG